MNDKYEWYPFRGVYPITVRGEKEGWLRVFDGHREAWANKDDFVQSRDAPAHVTDRIRANAKSAAARARPAPTSAGCATTGIRPTSRTRWPSPSWPGWTRPTRPAAEPLARERRDEGQGRGVVSTDRNGAVEREPAVSVSRSVV